MPTSSPRELIHTHRQRKPAIKKLIFTLPNKSSFLSTGTEFVSIPFRRVTTTYSMEAPIMKVNKRNQENPDRTGNERGFILMAACSLILFAYLLSVHAASSSNWLIIPILALACPIVHLLTQRRPYGR